MRRGFSRAPPHSSSTSNSLERSPSRIKNVQLKKCSYVGNCHIYEPHDVYCCLDFFLLLVCDRLTTRNTHGLDPIPYISRGISECTFARSRHPLDTTNISIHHWMQTTNVRSVLWGCENRYRRHVGTGSVETVYYGTSDLVTTRAPWITKGWKRTCCIQTILLSEKYCAMTYSAE